MQIGSKSRGLITEGKKSLLSWRRRGGLIGWQRNGRSAYTRLRAGLRVGRGQFTFFPAKSYFPIGIPGARPSSKSQCPLRGACDVAPHCATLYHYAPARASAYAEIGAPPVPARATAIH